MIPRIPDSNARPFGSAPEQPIKLKINTSREFQIGLADSIKKIK
jgi:hypothetical protein